MMFRRLRRARRRRWVVAIGLVAAVAGAAWWLRRSTPPAMSTCERSVRSGDWRRGVEVCLVRFAWTGDAHDLSWAAQGQLYLGELDQAEVLARWLLTGSLEGVGHRILGHVRLRRGSWDAARMHAERALAAHQRAGDERNQTSDAVLLAQVTWKLGELAASLEAADRALSLARKLRDPRNEVVAQLARADALRRMGDTHGAVAALRSAIDRADTACDRAWSHLKMGMCQMELGQDGMARLELTNAARANEQCGAPAISTSVAHNQAWLLRWKDPAGALARLDELERAHGDRVEAQLLRGYLAADRGALADADRYLARAAAMKAPDADWPWEIARAQAELAELRGGWFADLLAEYHYRRATAMIAALRSNARARSAYLVSSHRGPYDGLIAMLARSGRWRDALALILELDASDMLRATAAEVVVHDRAPLAPSAPGAGAAALPPPPAIEDVLAAWGRRELVIVVAPSRRQIEPGGERVYRLLLTGGEVTGEDVGDAGAAWRWAAALFADPGDRSAARALGQMIVPPGASGETLHVLAPGPLGGVPLAALRDAGGAPIVASRPLVRLLALRASGPESAGSGPPVVIADPLGDLHGAAAEGAMVAAALGAAAQVSGSRTSSPATRARLWAARDAAVLHVAAHVADRGRGRALRLADGDVASSELVRERLAPRLAVLAGCGSAAATDTEGWGSIAAALLESGAAAVIATDRSVSVGDAAALTVMREFYAQPDWRADPARALARVQHALDARAATSSDEATKPRAWAAFFVLRRPPAIPSPADGPSW
jgi:tetratricopeptide (TPR) repeat protein